jgi:hypothetical protein
MHTSGYVVAAGMLLSCSSPHSAAPLVQAPLSSAPVVLAPSPSPAPAASPPEVSAPAGVGCDVAKCDGSVSPALQAALTFATKSAHRCYDEALRTAPTLQGRVKLQVRISEAGEVCAVRTVSSELPDPSVSDCMAAKLSARTRHFPAPEGGCLEVVIPIDLRPPPPSVTP